MVSLGRSIVRDSIVGTVLSGLNMRGGLFREVYSDSIVGTVLSGLNMRGGLFREVNSDSIAGTAYFHAHAERWSYSSYQ